MEGSAVGSYTALDRVRTTDETICRGHMLTSVWLRETSETLPCVEMKPLS